MKYLRLPTQFLLSSFVLVLILALTAHELYAQTEDNGFYLHDNGVTIVCDAASVGDSGTINGVTYTKIDSEDSLQVFGGGVPADQACTSGVTSMRGWLGFDFPDDNVIKHSYNPDISHWDVSDVTDMTFLFNDLRGFNQDLSNWDVSSVEKFVATFQKAYAFNSNISSWDVSSGKIFYGMFWNAVAFNVDIGDWDVSGLDPTITYPINSKSGMANMFGNASNFNQDLSGWCVSALDSPEHYNKFAQNAPLQSNYYPQWGQCPANDPNFELADNGVTVTCIDAEVGAKGTIAGKTYTKIDSKNDLILFGGDVRADEACTSGITIMNQWFINQTNFTEDISHWDVSEVTNMNSMFFEAENFNADLQHWDVGKVSTFSYMFTGAEVFNADISSWNTSSATNMEYMFGVAASFNQDISGWDVSNVTHMNDMFDGARVFNQDLSQWNVGKVTNMKEMFQGANAFNQDIGHWDVSNVTNMTGMFRSADAFNQDLSGWCVSNLSATSSRENFNQEGVIPTSYLPQWGECPPNDPAFELAGNGVTVTCKGVSAGTGGTIASVTYTKVDQRTDLDLYSGGTVPADQACTSDVTNMSRWFHQASPFNDDISHWDVSSVTNMSEMFKSAINFNKDLNHWDVSNLQNANEMFSAATNFNGNIDSWQTLSLLQMEEMFAYTNEFNRDIGSWEVSNVSNVDGLFVAAEKFNQDLSQWNLSKATDYSSMFEGADAFNQDLSSWDVSHVVSMNSMFYHADAFDQDLSSWCVENVTSASNYERFADQTLLTANQVPLWGKCPVGDVVLSSPEDGATGVSINPTLSWQAADRAEGYYVSISKPEEFIIETVSGTSLSLSDLSFESTHLWSVVPYNTRGTGHEGNSSGTRSFTTQEDPNIDPPAAPTLSSPEANATDVELNIALSWEAPDGAEAYVVELFLGDNEQGDLKLRTTTVNSLYPLTDLRYQQIYAWRVRAVNEGGYGEWSEVRTFTTIDYPIPSKVSLVAPLDQAANTPITPTLSWDTTQYASEYEVQVTVDGFETTSVNSTLDGTSLALSSLNYSTAYEWRVRAVNAYDVAGEWSETRSFSTREEPNENQPGTPTLVSPDNGASDLETVIDLQWNSAEKALNYTVQVSNNEFASTVFETTTDQTSATTSTLSFETTYKWRVIASNDDGQGNWSAVRNFTTKQTPAPGQASLAAPSDDAEGVNPETTLQWSPVTYATAYDLEVRKGTSVVIAERIGATQYNVTLESGETYSWRVRAVNNTAEGTWSSLWSFRTAQDAVGRLTLLAPSHQATNVSTSPLMKWTSATNATSYEIQMSDTEFESLNMNETVADTLHQASGLQHNHTYQWRVRGLNADNVGEWSSTMEFKTRFPQVSTPTLIQPAQNASDVPIPTVFGWEATNNATSYEIELFTDALLTTVFSLDVTDTTYTYADMQEQKDYLFRVRAKNAAGTSSWSNVEFRTGENEVGTSTEWGGGAGDGTGADADGIPTTYGLEQNYPNPFNPSTVIRYAVPQAGEVQLEVYDMMGRKVSTLVRGTKPAGYHEAVFDASHLGSGAYMYRLMAGDVVLARTLYLIK